jgi:hypothetical protein
LLGVNYQRNQFSLSLPEMLSINIKRKFEMNEGCPFFEKFLRFLLKKNRKKSLDRQ